MRHRLRALGNRQREATRLPLGGGSGVHEDAIGAAARKHARHARRAAGAAVVVDNRVVEIVTADDQHRIEIVRAEVDGDRLSRRRRELIRLHIAAVGIQRIAARQPPGDRFAHAHDGSRYGRALLGNIRHLPDERGRPPRRPDGGARVEAAVALRFGRRLALRHAQPEMAGLTARARGAVHDDPQWMIVLRGVDETGVAAATAVVVLDELLPASPGEQDVGIEIARFEIHRESLLGAHRQDPALEVRRVTVEFRILRRQLAADRLPDLDHPRHPAESAADRVRSDRATARCDGQPVVAELSRRARIRVEAVVAGDRRHERQPRIAASAAVVVARERISRCIGDQQIRVEVVGGEIEGDRVAFIRGEGIHPIE